jgi:hypothetical protein
MSGPLHRILRKTGMPGLLEVLSERLGASDLQSLLLEVFRRRAAAGSPGELMARYAKSRFTAPAAIPATRFLELDALAASLLPDGFEMLDLSPVAPLGATAIVTGTSQNRIVSTVRNTEVAADSTNALALECAARRRARLSEEPKSASVVRLAASQRLVRAQYSDNPIHLAHFRLFGLCTAGRDRGSFSFELAQLPEHLSFHVAVLEAWLARGAPGLRARVRLTRLDDGPGEDVLEERVLAPLRARHPDAGFELDPSREHGRGYYRTACFKVHVEEPDGESLELGDGGFTDWTQQLAGSRKERLLISGMGCDRLAGLHDA